MANNRMYLVHKVTGKAILLAKYYPESGWYQFHSQELYNEFFAESINTGTFGDTDYELRFEHDATKPLTGEEKFPYAKLS